MTNRSSRSECAMFTIVLSEAVYHWSGFLTTDIYLIRSPGIHRFPAQYLINISVSRQYSHPAAAKKKRWLGLILRYKMSHPAPHDVFFNLRIYLQTAFSFSFSFFSFSFSFFFPFFFFFSFFSQEYYIACSYM